MRKIPLKNYFILIALVAITVFITYYCCNLYSDHHEKKHTSLMLTFLTEIKEDDIENYIVENPTVVLYISDKTDSSLEESEKEFKKYLAEKNIYSYFTYIDISKDKENSLNSFQEGYDITLDYQTLPILITFQDGEFKEVYNKSWDMSQVTDFLRRNEVVDCD